MNDDLAIDPFVYALVEAMVPDTDEGALLDETTRFVSSQLAALPPLFRSAMKAGLASLSAAAFARHRRRFISLPLDTRRAFLDACATSPLPPVRMVLRPVRSTALLAYYELEGEL